MARPGDNAQCSIGELAQYIKRTYNLSPCQLADLGNELLKTSGVQPDQKIREMVHDAAIADEMFGADELERWAGERTSKGASEQLG
jgi:hypothetical protein